MHLLPKIILLLPRFQFCITLDKMHLQNKMEMRNMKQYKVIVNPNVDPEITLRLPQELLRDLALRSEENGRDIAMELSIRLARSLERDLEMIEEDNQTAYRAFEIVSARLND
jgi:hypothetical protein